MKAVDDGTLPAVSCSLVGDIADVVRIETLRSAPLIVHWSAKAIPALDRTFSLRPRFIESSPFHHRHYRPDESLFCDIDRRWFHRL